MLKGATVPVLERLNEGDQSVVVGLLVRDAESTLPAMTDYVIYVRSRDDGAVVRYGWTSCVESVPGAEMLPRRSQDATPTSR